MANLCGIIVDIKTSEPVGDDGGFIKELLEKGSKEPFVKASVMDLGDDYMFNCHYESEGCRARLEGWCKWSIKDSSVKKLLTTLLSDKRVIEIRLTAEEPGCGIYADYHWITGTMFIQSRHIEQCDMDKLKEISDEDNEVTIDDIWEVLEGKPYKGAL